MSSRGLTHSFTVKATRVYRDFPHLTVAFRDGPAYKRQTHVYIDNSVVPNKLAIVATRSGYKTRRAYERAGLKLYVFKVPALGKRKRFNR